MRGVLLLIRNSMPSAASVAIAMTKHRNMLVTAHGQPIILDGGNGFGTYNPPHHEQQLVEGGFKDVYTTTLRIRKADWPGFQKPSDFLKKVVQIRVGNVWQNFGIIAQGVTDINLSAEWKLQLEGLT